MPNPSFPQAIDSTMLSAYSACPRLFQLSHIEHWGPAGGEGSIHLLAGAAYAKGLETARRAFFEGESASEARELGLAALDLAYGEDDHSDQTKSRHRMLGAMDFYLDNYPLDTDSAQVAVLAGQPAVEWSFAIPLPINHPDTGQPLLFCGRCDALVRYAGGLYALDDKTTSQLGASWSRQWDLRGQFTAYAWAMQQVDLEPRGTIVRGLSILKTKYETQQALIPQPGWKIDRWFDTSMAKIERMIHDYRNGRFLHDLSESCNHYGGCGFKGVCLSQDPEAWLQTCFEHHQWLPLEHIK